MLLATRLPAHARRRGPRRAASCGNERGTRSTRRSRPCSPTMPETSWRRRDLSSAWDETLAREPEPQLFLRAQAIDRALAAMGNFADLVSPYLVGHSAGVAELAAAAGRQCGLDDAGRGQCGVQRSSTTSDGSPSRRGVWQKARPADGGRVGAGQAARRTTPSGCWPIPVPRRDRAGCDRSPRAARRHRISPRRRGASLAPPMRLLAAADAYHAMTEPRPHRRRCPPRGRGEALASEADGRAARRRRRRRGAGGRRTTRPTAGTAGRTHRARGRRSWRCSHAGCRPNRSRALSESRRRPPTATSRTPTPRSASRPAPPPRCSRWSTGSRLGRTPDVASDRRS